MDGVEGTGCGGRWRRATTPPFPHATSGHSCGCGLLVNTSPYRSQKRPSLGSKILWAPRYKYQSPRFTREETGLTVTSVSCTRPWREDGTELGWERILPDFRAQTFP